MIYGYARVSTPAQSVAGQISELQAAGAERVFYDVASGHTRDRLRLRKVLAAIGPGDILLVTRLDRLARSTRDLLNILQQIGAAGAGFRAIRDHWADTTSPHGRLVTTVLGGLAEFERELILARTDEGRRMAKQRGVKFGRKFALDPQQRAWVATQRRDTDASCRELAAILGVHWSTISRIAPAPPEAE